MSNNKQRIISKLRHSIPNNIIIEKFLAASLFIPANTIAGDMLLIHTEEEADSGLTN